MPKPNKFSYKKQTAYRDASLFVIICEGKNREPAYFRFFEGISSRVTIVPVPSEAGSSPNHLIETAHIKNEELKLKKGHDSLWFVIDTDRWREQLHDIRMSCERELHWKVVQSNPCFEVWLYFHAKKQLPANIGSCNSWKSLLPQVISGGFNADFHPIAIETAIANAKEMYQEEGYFPKPGSSQVWELAESLVMIISKDLWRLKQETDSKGNPKFPNPILL